MSSDALIVNCPTCGKPVIWSSRQRWRPFCSERCRLIDLGAWADESHRLPAQPDEGDEFIDTASTGSSVDPTRN